MSLKITVETFLFIPESSSMLSCSVFYSVFSATGTGKSLGMVGEIEDKVGRWLKGKPNQPGYLLSVVKDKMKFNFILTR